LGSSVLRNFTEIDSTNAEAHRLAAKGERGPLWLVADRQTAGRGRLGRNWISEPGNLYATVLFTIVGRAAIASQVSFPAALAVHEAVSSLLPKGRADLAIKWPNDVLLGGAKLAGILAETLRQDQGAVTLAIGFGINVALAPEGTPYPVTTLRQHGANASPMDVHKALSAKVEKWLAVWDKGRGFDKVRREWLAHASGLGHRFAATSGRAELSGLFVGLGDDGAMILELADGSRRAVHSGEVRLAAR
jgi:BirA family transcriptional regulator, biotin operon repressor / biotin---[acetyl-CoA-carboxylase] ligase